MDSRSSSARARAATTRSSSNGRCLRCDRAAFATRADSAAVARLGSILHARGPGKINAAVQVAERASIVAVLVLVIAFANVVNLLAARAVRRRREIAVRLALGSSASRLVRLLVSESVQLALLAAVAALAAAWWGGSLLRSLLMPDVTWAENPLHWRVLLLGIGAASRDRHRYRSRSGAPVACPGPYEGAENGGSRRRRAPFAPALIPGGHAGGAVGDAARWCCALHSEPEQGSGPRHRLHRRSSGIRRRHRGERRGAASRHLESTAGTRRANGNVPGVDQVGYTSMRPKWGISFTSFFAEGRDPTAKRGGFYSAVSPGYFEATGTRILKGRTFATGAASRAERVVLVNETLADSLWAGQDPLGKMPSL